MPLPATNKKKSVRSQQSSSDKNRVSLEVFTQFVLPSLREQHGEDIAGLQKAINDHYTVFSMDGSGNEIEKDIDVSLLDVGGGDDDDDTGGGSGASNGGGDEFKGDEASVMKLVEQVVAKAAKRIVDNKGGNIRVLGDREDEDPKSGFRSFGDYSRAVKKHTVGGGTDERLRRSTKALNNYSNEGIGTDGGFLVPHDFAKELLRYAVDEQSLLPYTKRVVVAGNSITMPIDKSTPWGSTGIQAYWTGEAGIKADSKPEFGEVTETLHKITVLVPVTDELLQDSFISLGSYIGDMAALRIRSKLNTAIVKGTGVGQPKGYRNSGALKMVAAESGQTADTVNVANVAKMFASMPVNSISNAVWLINPQVFPQLVTLTIGNQPVWIPSVRDAAAGSLFGRPVIPVQDMSILGDVGDIDFVDLSQYLTISKGTGIESAVSIHLYFDRNITTFRFETRIGGRAWMDSAYTGKDAVNTYSPFVTLAAR